MPQYSKREKFDSILTEKNIEFYLVYFFFFVVSSYNFIEVCLSPQAYKAFFYIYLIKRYVGICCVCVCVASITVQLRVKLFLSFVGTSLLVWSRDKTSLDVWSRLFSKQKSQHGIYPTFLS